MQHGSWVNDIQITTSYRTYPKFGNNGGSYSYSSGLALRYIGCGESSRAMEDELSSHVLAAGVELHFVCSR